MKRRTAASVLTLLCCFMSKALSPFWNTSHLKYTQHMHIPPQSIIPPPPHTQQTDHDNLHTVLSKELGINTVTQTSLWPPWFDSLRFKWIQSEILKKNIKDHLQTFLLFSSTCTQRTTDTNSTFSVGFRDSHFLTIFSSYFFSFYMFRIKRFRTMQTKWDQKHQS